MSIAATIEHKVKERLQPSVLRIENESHRHAGPATESHFKLLVVADDFAQLNRVKRHQMIYGLLADEMANGVHALALHLYSPSEWQESGNSVPDSPNCRGGEK